MARQRKPGRHTSALPASAAVKPLSGPEAVSIAKGIADGLARIGGLSQVDSLLEQLRKSREFSTLCSLGSTLLGQGTTLSARARLFIAQACIEGGRFDEATGLLDGVIEGRPDGGAMLEAQGLRGRIFKQKYVNQAVRGRKDAALMHAAVNAYLGAYDGKARPEWHGVNAAALLTRAARDGIRGAPIDRRLTIARQIRDRLTTKPGAETNYWDAANIAEASLVLEDLDTAELWYHRAAWAPDATPFTLAGTLRQLREVWRLDPATTPGARILPPLDARLHQAGHTLLVSPEKVADADSFAKLEKVFGRSPYMPFEAWAMGIECAKSVCRVEDKLNQGVGTGFVVEGRQLSAKLPNEPVLITNAHVLTKDGDGGSLTPGAAHATFYASKDKSGRPHTTGIRKIVWSSPPGAFDATVALLTRPPKASTPLCIAERLPVVGDKPKVYVIGHPGGGALVFSLNDNDLLDHGDPDDFRVHYRTPTEPGSSGSPVFDANWELIALHHAGDSAIRRIHGTGTYQANEGIALKHIAKAIRPK